MLLNLAALFPMAIFCLMVAAIMIAAHALEKRVKKLTRLDNRVRGLLSPPHE